MGQEELIGDAGAETWGGGGGDLSVPLAVNSDHRGEKAARG